MKISNRHQHAVNSLIWAYCSNGNFEEAKALMNELEKDRLENILPVLLVEYLLPI